MPRVRNETREVLELFVRKARDLESRTFIKTLKERGPSWTWIDPGPNGTWVIKDVDPNDEAGLAFLATFRLFTQTEPISLGSLAKILDDPDLTDKWKRKFAKIRNSVNYFLDEVDTVLPPTTDFPTRREIMLVFINGWIFHVKDSVRRPIFEKWATYGDRFVLLVNRFNFIVATVYDAIIYIARLTEQELNAK
jgi:hypothetical protein